MKALKHTKKIGCNSIVSAAIPDDVLKRLDARCERYGVKRSLVIRDMISFALDFAEKMDQKNG